MDFENGCVVIIDDQIYTINTLGSGDSKVAWSLTDEGSNVHSKALLTSHIVYDKEYQPAKFNWCRWGNMVDDEVQIGAFLEKKGLLTPHNEKVTVIWNNRLKV